MQLKLAMLILGGVGVAFGASMADRSMNYTKVSGTIQSAELDCFVENSSGKLVEKDSDSKAYMDCAIAPAIAVQFGYSESDVKQRAKFTYQYTSPVDGSVQVKENSRVTNVAAYSKGATLTVYAHNEDPAKSRLD